MLGEKDAIAIPAASRFKIFWELRPLSMSRTRVRRLRLSLQNLLGVETATYTVPTLCPI